MAVTARTRTTATVQVLDISVGGMRVLSGQPLSPKREIVAWVPTQDGEVRIRAKVLRCRARLAEKPLPSGASLVYDAGLSFSELSEEERRSIVESYLQVKHGPHGDDGRALVALTQAINGKVHSA